MPKINDIEFLGDKIIGIENPEEVFSEEILKDLKELREFERNKGNVLTIFVLILAVPLFLFSFFIKISVEAIIIILIFCTLYTRFLIKPFIHKRRRMILEIKEKIKNELKA